MSFDPDDAEKEITLITQNERIISLLKAILLGIEIISDSDTGSLIEDIEEE